MHLGVSLQVWPNIETGNPFAKDSILRSKRDPENARVLGPDDLLETLPACSSDCIR